MCQCRKLPVCVELVIGCAFLIGLGRCEAVAADWKQRLLSEAPAKWAALEQYYLKVDLSYRTIFARAQGNPVPGAFEGTTYYEFRRNGDMLVATSHRVGSAGGEQIDTIRVDGVNSRYSFRLGKSKPDAETFILANFEAASDKTRRILQEKVADNAYSVLGFRLSKIIEGPPFTIRDVQSVQRKGKELVQLELDQNIGSGKGAEIQHITVILDPDHYWSVQECQFESSNSKGEESME